MQKPALQSEIYKDMDKIKSQVAVASQIMQSKLSLRPVSDQLKMHPVVMYFPDYDDVILVNVFRDIEKGMHQFALENRYNPAASQQEIAQALEFHSIWKCIK